MRLFYKWYGLFVKVDGDKMLQKPITLKMRTTAKYHAENRVSEKIMEMNKKGWRLEMDSGLVRCNKRWKPI